MTHIGSRVGLLLLLLLGCGSPPPTSEDRGSDATPLDADSAEIRVEDAHADDLPPDTVGGPCQPPVADETECDDGDPCTEDDRCDAGQCHGTKRDCRDDDPCSIDVCDPFAGCVNTVLQDAACDDGDACTGPDRCTGGQCTAPEVADGTPCDNANACVVASGCFQGVCESLGVLECPESSNPCETNVCHPDVGCRTSVKLDGAPCSAGSACRATGTCQDGFCAEEPLANGTPCGSGSPCEGAPVCLAGECVGGALAAVGTACESLDACIATASCDATGACVPSKWLDCDDGNSCTSDGCSAATGCLHAPQSEGSPCDGACGLVGTCHGGTCDGPPPCGTFGGPCEEWVCGDGGGCIPAGPKVDGSPCGSICAPAKCASGVCGPPELVDCFDGDACVERQCLPPVGCVSVGNKSAFCNADGDDCTLLDRCQQGSCEAAAGCDDFEPCTNDSCEQGSCVHAWTPDAGCDDEAVCDDGLDEDGDGRIDCLDRRCERSDPTCLATAVVGGVIDLDAAGMGSRVAVGLPAFARSGGSLTLSGAWSASPSQEARVDATLCCFESAGQPGDLWLVFREVTTFPSYGDGCPGTTDHLVTRRVSVESPFAGSEDFPLYTLYQGGLPLSDTPCGVPTWRTLKVSALAMSAVPLTRVRLRFQASFLGAPFTGGQWSVSEVALVGPESCDNDVDDNGDLRVDCDDPLCFGACTASP